MILSRVNGVIVLTASAEETAAMEQRILEQSEAEVVARIAGPVTGWMAQQEEAHSRLVFAAYKKSSAFTQSKIDALMVDDQVDKLVTGGRNGTAN